MTVHNHTIRVLIVDDHTIVRKGIKALLAETSEFEVVGEAENGLEAIRLSKELEPDVILMDLLMPKMDGIEATRQITAQQPQVHVLVLTSFIGDDKVYPAIKAGALGYLLKDSEPTELIRSIKRVDRGEPFLQPMVARKMMKDILEQPIIKPTPDPLTARELEVLHLLAKGLSNEEIAAQLVVSEVTVRTHISHLLAKLHLANRVQATLYALREGITSIGDENEKDTGEDSSTDVDSHP
jgi:two-component system, NarL family, response regulator LiaR